MEWFESSFGKDYLMVYAHRDETAAEREATQVIKWLKLPTGSRIVDYCCGNGRHAVAVAGHGYQVSGMDLSADLLMVASKRSVKPGVALEWHQGDARQAPFNNETFDGLMNLFTSFGYLATDEENEQVICEMVRVLRTGGRMVMDYLNAGRVRANLVPYSERDVGEMKIEERRWIADQCVHKEIRILEVGQSPRVYLERVRLYEKSDLIEMLARNGVQIEEVYGDFDEAEFDPMLSPRLILVGTLLRQEKG